MYEHSHDAPMMYVTAAIALGAMVATYIAFSVIGKKFKQNIPLAIVLFVTSAVGALASGFGIPIRHLFEGQSWYIYINLVICTGMIFLQVMKKAGSLDCITWDILINFRKRPLILFLLLGALLYFPGMVTGVGTAAVLSTGIFAVTIMRIVGIPAVETAAVVALLTTFGAAAPPVNIPALIIASGINMPYEGFSTILWVLTIPPGIFTIFFVAYRHFKEPSEEDIRAQLQKPERKNAIMPYIPLVVVGTIFVLIRVLPGKFPDLITPLVFMIGSIVALFVGRKVNFFEASREAVSGGIFSTVALLFVVGTVVQITTLTGAKGLVVLGCLELGAVSPLLMYVAVGLSIPLLGGVLTHLGAAAILGVPFTLALLTQNVIVVTAAISMLCVLAQNIPPSALGGYFAQDLVKLDRYSDILKKSAIPIILTAIYSVIVIVYANKFAALFVPF